MQLHPEDLQAIIALANDNALGLHTSLAGPALETRNSEGRIVYRVLLDAVPERIAYQEWFGRFSPAQAKHLLRSHLLPLVRLGCTRNLMDATEFQGTWSETLPWLRTELVPELRSLGLRCIAIVMARDVFAQTTGRVFMEEAIDLGVPTRRLPSAESALLWMRGQPG